MKNNQRLLIIGASGHGKVVADVAIKSDQWCEIVFLDDNEAKTEALGLKVIGKTSEISKYIDDYSIIVGIGNNEIREELFTNLEGLGATMPVLIHPEAIIGNDVTIGKGTIIMAGAIISCSTTIGKGCIVNTASTVDHDNQLGDFVHISPGVHLAGSVKIEKKTWLGTGSVVSNNLNITKECTIGAGTVVIRNIDEIGTYVGVPSRKI